MDSMVVSIYGYLCSGSCSCVWKICLSKYASCTCKLFDLFMYRKFRVGMPLYLSFFQVVLMILLMQYCDALYKHVLCKVIT
jgi:hypothetical protein